MRRLSLYFFIPTPCKLDTSSHFNSNQYTQHTTSILFDLFPDRYKFIRYMISSQMFHLIELGQITGHWQAIRLTVLGYSAVAQLLGEGCW